MTMTQHLIQAYHQAPWRVQLQRLGVIFAVLVAIGLVAIIYISISAQAAAAGMEFQKLEVDREDFVRQNADQSNKLASLTSEENMQARAKELGFKPLSTEKAVYVIVPNYPGRQEPSFAPLPSADRFSEPLLKPGYTESLWEVLFRGVLSLTNPEVTLR
jgi:cell division protein FtsL